MSGERAAGATATPGEATLQRRVIDVGELPDIAFHHRDPMWWAVALLVAIEGTMLVLLALAYFYVRDRVAPWPPVLVPRHVAWLATAELGVLVVSAIPIHRASVAAIRGSVRGMRRWLIACGLLGLLAGALRWLVIDQLPMRWDADAYSSVVWTLLGFQALHGLTGLVEIAVFVVLLFVGPVEQKHRVDVHVSALLWYFVVAGALLLWAVVFLEILLTRSTA